jgi:hypothetical protein
MDFGEGSIDGSAGADTRYLAIDHRAGGWLVRRSRVRRIRFADTGI